MIYSDPIEINQFNSGDWVAHHGQHDEVLVDVVTLTYMCGTLQVVKISRAIGNLNPVGCKALTGCWYFLYIDRLR